MPFSSMPRPLSMWYAALASCRNLSASDSNQVARALSSSALRSASSMCRPSKVASTSEMLVASPWPGRPSPVINTATPSLSFSHSETLLSVTLTLTSFSGSGMLPSIFGKASTTRSRRLPPNSSSSKSSAMVALSTGRNAKSAGPTSKSISVIICVSVRFKRTCSMRSRRLLPTTPLISSAWPSRFSKSLYCRIHFSAVFSPTLGTPGRLSELSPRSAA